MCQCDYLTIRKSDTVLRILPVSQIETKLKLKVWVYTAFPAASQEQLRPMKCTV